MTYAQFLEAFNPVIEAYGSNKFPTVVLERIHDKVDGLTPTQMRELCHEIVDHCEHAPRTAKVMEFANLVRARHRIGLHDQPRDAQIFCSFCQDLRVVRGVATDNSHETLMLCDCTTRHRDPSDWPVPAWSRDWAPLYRKERCPVSWFVPVIVARNANGSIKLSSTENNQRYWREKIRIAEEFWKRQKAECQGDISG